MIKAAETKISVLIEDGAIVPMRFTTDALEWLEELAKTIRETSENGGGDGKAAYLALTRVSRLAALAAYIAADTSEYIGCAREDMEGERLASILAAAKGGKAV